jgi:hypothetical protein
LTNRDRLYNPDFSTRLLIRFSSKRLLLPQIMTTTSDAGTTGTQMVTITSPPILPLILTSTSTEMIPRMMVTTQHQQVTDGVTDTLPATNLPSG